MSSTRLFSKISLGLLLVISTLAAFSQPEVAQSQSRKYFCARSGGVYKTFVNTVHGPIPIIQWVDNNFQVSPRTRCITVSKRFEAFDQNRILKYMRAGRVNRSPVICVAHRKGGNCPSNNVLVTLTPGTDANYVLNQLLNIRGRAREGGIPLTDDLYFYVNGDLHVDIDNLLEELEKEANKVP